MTPVRKRAAALVLVALLGCGLSAREDAHMWILPEDRAAVEETASRAVKLGQADGVCRVHHVDGSVSTLSYRLLWRVCSHCHNQCAVMLGHADEMKP